MVRRSSSGSCNYGLAIPSIRPDPLDCEDTDNIQEEIAVRVDALVFLTEERLRQSIPLGGLIQ